MDGRIFLRISLFDASCNRYYSGLTGHIMVMSHILFFERWAEGESRTPQRSAPERRQVPMNERRWEDSGSNPVVDQHQQVHRKCIVHETHLKESEYVLDIYVDIHRNDECIDNLQLCN